MTLTNEDLQALSDIIDKKLEPIKSDIQSMKSNMQSMSNNISDIELHLENTTDNNIKFIAEGHLDLSRKLDKALEVEHEKELLIIRVNYLESEVKRIKRRLAEIS